jgi:hypothetical protein
MKVRTGEDFIGMLKIAAKTASEDRPSNRTRRDEGERY